MKEVEMELAISLGEYNGRPQLNTRVIAIHEKESKPAASISRTGTVG
jgi:hypothetical protein